jgi:hypothetical protein
VNDTAYLCRLPLATANPVTDLQMIDVGQSMPQIQT